MSRFQDLQREEVQLTEDIRAASRAGNDTSVRILAQQMVRLRAHIKLQQTTRAGLSGISATLSVSALCVFKDIKLPPLVFEFCVCVCFTGRCQHRCRGEYYQNSK